MPVAMQRSSILFLGIATSLTFMIPSAASACELLIGIPGSYPASDGVLPSNGRVILPVMGEVTELQAELGGVPVEAELLSWLTDITHVGEQLHDLWAVELESELPPGADLTIAGSYVELDGTERTFAFAFTVGQPDDTPPQLDAVVTLETQSFEETSCTTGAVRSFALQFEPPLVPTFGHHAKFVRLEVEAPGFEGPAGLVTAPIDSADGVSEVDVLVPGDVDPATACVRAELIDATGAALPIFCENCDDCGVEPQGPVEPPDEPNEPGETDSIVFPGCSVIPTPASPATFALVLVLAGLVRRSRAWKA